MPRTRDRRHRPVQPDVDAVRSDLDAMATEEAGGVVDTARPAVSAIGLLVRGLAARRRAGGPPINVLSCDNMADNGTVLAGLVRAAVAAALPGSAGASLRSWLAEAVTFPCSMVDRITPTTTTPEYCLPPLYLDYIGGLN